MSGRAMGDEDLRHRSRRGTRMRRAQALTGEVLAAAEEIYRFLKGQRDDDAGSGTAH
jgi:hypothetical protein